MSAPSPSPGRPSPMCALAALLCALCSTGCGPALQRPLLLGRQPPAELVRACPGEPPLPASFADDAAQAQWINDAIEAGAECRAAHARLAEWASTPP
jgi:hypothetical protein